MRRTMSDEMAASRIIKVTSASHQGSPQLA
jgi:hypothetical protein